MNGMNTENQLEISEYSGSGFCKAVHGGKWRIAFLNFAEKFREDNIRYLERHLETDEAFILLDGSAVLIIGTDMKKIKLEPHKIYNVKKNVWHNIILSESSKLLLVENEDTGKDNTEYFYI